jgi:6-phosphogluconolactonase
VTAKPEVVVELDADQLAGTVADNTVTALATAQASYGEATLVVTGGSILEKVQSAIARSPRATEVDWSRVDVFWGDERFVPSDSPDRNDQPVRRLLTDRLPFAADRIHPMPSTNGPDGADVDAAANRYAALLAERARPDHRYEDDVPAFDVILLGIGPDGHCASLFPDHPGVDDEGPSVVGVHDSPKPPPTRISLTFRALNAAEQVWVIASGDGKADAVARALGGADRVHVPSAGARGRTRTVWWLDRDAAAQLEQES